MREPSRNTTNAEALGLGGDAPAPRRTAGHVKSPRPGFEALGGPGAALWLGMLAACGSDTGGSLYTQRGGGVQAPGSPGISLPSDALANDATPQGSGAGECAGITLAAETQRGPADIIFALDNSGSMDEEAAFVQQNMNAFSDQIVAAAIDTRVVVISSYPGTGNGICLDAPLGSGGCPNGDTRLPTFLHVDQEVDSNNALELMIANFPDYRDVLRPEALKHLVVVTDDQSDLSAAAATRGILGLEPPMFEGFIFHSIYAFTEGEGDHCEEFSSGEGTVYRQLVAETNGVSGDLCLQDFKPVFDRLAQAVVANSRIACQLAIPDPPAGAVFDASLTNIQYASGSLLPIGIPRTASAAGCQAAPNRWAWHYDDEANPSQIVLCPDTCSGIRGDLLASVNVQFGCPTIEVVR